MPAVYLDSSFFGSCVNRRQDAKSIAFQSESRRWWTQQRRNFKLCNSAEVVRELSDDAFPDAQEALILTRDCTVLAVTDAVRAFARTLVGEHVMPGPAETGDAVHVAVAAVHACDHLLTWNVKHLANPNKRAHLRNICGRYGFSTPDIVMRYSLWLPESGGHS